MIRTIINEQVRGCGYRKPGGTYLVNDGPGFSCNRLPIPLETCPCCNAGIKPARGWTWINGKMILENSEKWNNNVCASCGKFTGGCTLLFPSEKTGLIWVGEEFYKTPEAFTLEASVQGISRRISKIPRDFKVGETPVWLAHRKAVPVICVKCNDHNELFCPKCSGSGMVMIPGVFSVFTPSRIEYIITGEETEKQLARKESQGITLIKLERAI